VRQPAALMKSAASAEPEDADSNMYKGALQRPLHHIAVMRAPNFVVKYVEGPPMPYELVEYAGVFRVDSEADAAFARAEPPTHDDWIPDLLLDAAEKTFVRVAQRKLKEVLQAYAAPPAIEAAGGGTGTHSVAAFSRLLGGLLPSLNSDANRPARPPSTSLKGEGKSGAGRRGAPAPQIAFVDEPNTVLVDGIPAMVARFQVFGQASKHVRVLAQAKVVIADGFESDPPEGAERPQVLKWVAPDGQTVAAGNASCEVPVDNGIWTVVVSIPPDAMIAVDLKVESKGGK
jgi:hypothetical protein